MASTEEINIEAAKKFIEIVNQTPDWIEQTHAKDCIYEALPTETYPNGIKGGFDELKEASRQTYKLFPDRKLKILNLVAGGDQVALDLGWTGTLSMTFSDAATEGDIIKLRVAMFLQFRERKIIKMTDFYIMV